MYITGFKKGVLELSVFPIRWDFFFEDDPYLLLDLEDAGIGYHFDCNECMVYDGWYD